MVNNDFTFLGALCLNILFAGANFWNDNYVD